MSGGGPSKPRKQSPSGKSPQGPSAPKLTPRPKPKSVLEFEAHVRETLGKSVREITNARIRERASRPRPSILSESGYRKLYAYNNPELRAELQEILDRYLKALGITNEKRVKVYNELQSIVTGTNTGNYQSCVNFILGVKFLPTKHMSANSKWYVTTILCNIQGIFKDFHKNTVLAAFNKQVDSNINFLTLQQRVKAAEDEQEWMDIQVDDILGVYEYAIHDLLYES